MNVNIRTAVAVLTTVIAAFCVSEWDRGVRVDEFNFSNTTVLRKKEPSTFTADGSDLYDKRCQLTPWSLDCYSWYNSGNWTVRNEPRTWNQTFGYLAWREAIRQVQTPKRCELLGKALEWKSRTNNPSTFDADTFLDVLGQIKL